MESELPSQVAQQSIVGSSATGQPATTIHGLGVTSVSKRALRRLLVVDDNLDIHEDFRKTLGQVARTVLLDAAEAALLDCEPEPRTNEGYALDCASQGLEAIQLVEQLAARGEYYSAAFVDIRMPPGMDGVETAQQMWTVDPGLQIVFCTAYSDYTWESMVRCLGPNHSFLVLKKPFDTIEVRQIALALSEKRHLLRENEQYVLQLETRVKERTTELEVAHAKLHQEMQDRLLLEKGLRQTQKLEALGRLAAGIGHEINNPLAYVMNNLELLNYQFANLDGPSNEAANGAIGEALLGAQRIKQVVRGLRLYSRSAESPPAESDVNACISAAAAMVRSELRHKATLTEDLTDVPHVVGDPPRLEQVFVNLLLNAIQAIPKRGACVGEVRVFARCVDEETVEVCVTDNGCGIAASDLEQIFDPFFSTHPTGEGTGLGLWVCKTVIDSFGGKILVESASERGTVVRVRLRVAS